MGEQVSHALIGVFFFPLFFQCFNVAEVAIIDKRGFSQMWL
jgi:hypothetical protein